uniref:hypothetical protein n=1 Tax=uncultured Prevotella sp. TaxID=159272 RepID=UPI00265D0E28
MLLRLKIHVCCLIIHPDKQTNVNHLEFLHRVINIRYLFVFQIEKGEFKQQVQIYSILFKKH